jgi:hypothetical protein
VFIAANVLTLNINVPRNWIAAAASRRSPGASRAGEAAAGGYAGESGVGARLR